jgi:hypothetical protein
MPRDFRLYLEDVIEAIAKIRRYTAGLSFHQFAEDEKAIDAVVRNLEVIGEAVKRIPEDMRQKHAGMITAIAGLLTFNFRSLVLLSQFFTNVTCCQRTSRPVPRTPPQVIPFGPLRGVSILASSLLSFQVLICIRPLPPGHCVSGAI